MVHLDSRGQRFELKSCSSMRNFSLSGSGHRFPIFARLQASHLFCHLITLLPRQSAKVQYRNGTADWDGEPMADPTESGAPTRRNVGTAHEDTNERAPTEFESSRKGGTCMGSPSDGVTRHLSIMNNHRRTDSYSPDLVPRSKSLCFSNPTLTPR